MALSGLTPGHSTRLGAALRHAGAGLDPVASYRRLVLLVTDGEPPDFDADPAYLVADARRAVQALEAQRIGVFCIGVGMSAGRRLQDIFPPRAILIVNRIEALSESLSALYLRRTRRPRASHRLGPFA